MNICKKLLKVLLCANQSGLVSTLPEPPHKPMSFIESSSNPTLDSGHGSPERDLAGLNHQVIVR